MHPPVIQTINMLPYRDTWVFGVEGCEYLLGHPIRDRSTRSLLAAEQYAAWMERYQELMVFSEDRKELVEAGATAYAWLQWRDKKETE